MNTKDWILLIVPLVVNGICSAIVIKYQNFLNEKLKKIEKSQIRKDTIFDSYLEILTELNDIVFILLSKFRLREDLKEDSEILKNRTNALTLFFNNNKFLLKNNEDKIELIRAKCGYSLFRLSQYTSLGDKAAYEYPAKEQEKLFNDLNTIMNTIQELKAEVIEK